MWKDEYEAWNECLLANMEYVDFWSDGAFCFWNVLKKVFPRAVSNGAGTTRRPMCLTSCHAKGKRHEIWTAHTREHAQRGFGGKQIPYFKSWTK